MDKGLKRFTKGRLRIAVMMAICAIAVAALPAIAYAAPVIGATSPGNGSTLNVMPRVVGAVVDSTLKLDTRSAEIAIDGADVNGVVVKNIGSISGSWVPAESLVGGQWRVTWSWNATPGTATEGSFYVYSGVLADGVHSVDATIADVGGAEDTASWSFTVAQAPVIGAVVPANGSTVNNGTPVITAVVSDNVAVTGVVAQVDGVTKTATLTSGKIVVSGFGILGTGPHTIYVGATDAAGNQSSKTWSFTVNAGATSLVCTSCHGTSYETKPAMGPDCYSCHGDSVYDIPAHGLLGTHDVPVVSIACTACHGTDLATVHQPVGCVCHSQVPLYPGGPSFSQEFASLITAGNAECTDCHEGEYAAHGFEDEHNASGHSTTYYGKKGVFEKFDGSTGNPTLLAEAERSFASITDTWLVEAGFAFAQRPAGWAAGSFVATLATTPMTTKWDFPTAQVFWAVGDGGNATDAMEGLTKDSVITCEDCHTGLVAYEVPGPHGANSPAMKGLDPDYPGEYAMAELTKYITSNNAYGTTEGELLHR